MADLVAVDDLPFIKDELFDGCWNGRPSSYGNSIIIHLITAHLKHFLSLARSPTSSIEMFKVSLIP
jgi:hypothetical protein